jgi:hypothetical protein
MSDWVNGHVFSGRIGAARNASIVSTSLNTETLRIEVQPERANYLNITERQGVTLNPGPLQPPQSAVLRDVPFPGSACGGPAVVRFLAAGRNSGRSLP